MEGPGFGAPDKGRSVDGFGCHRRIGRMRTARPTSRGRHGRGRSGDNVWHYEDNSPLHRHLQSVPSMPHLYELSRPTSKEASLFIIPKNPDKSTSRVICQISVDSIHSLKPSPATCGRAVAKTARNISDSSVSLASGWGLKRMMRPSPKDAAIIAGV